MMNSVLALTTCSIAAFVIPRVLRQNTQVRQAGNALLSIPLAFIFLGNRNDAQEASQLLGHANIAINGLHNYYWLTFFIVGLIKISTDPIFSTGLMQITWSTVILLAGVASFAIEKLRNNI